MRFNHKPFINYEISKAITTRSRLRHRFLKSRSEKNRKLICKRRNKCVSLLRKSKKDYFGNVSQKNITENKCFWKTVKPFLSKKISSSGKNKSHRRRKQLFINKLLRSCRRTE